jgi:hypothetical protein
MIDVRVLFSLIALYYLRAGTYRSLTVAPDHIFWAQFPSTSVQENGCSWTFDLQA